VGGEKAGFWGGLVPGFAYGSLSFEQWIQGRWLNLVELWGHWGIAFRHFFPFQALNQFHLLRDNQFLSLLLPAFTWIPAIFVLPLYVWRLDFLGRAKLPFAWLTLLALTSVYWVLLMYVPGRTILHQGSYLLPVLFVAAWQLMAFGFWFLCLWMQVPRMRKKDQKPAQAV
jgi:hypothetical protein